MILIKFTCSNPPIGTFLGTFYYKIVSNIEKYIVCVPCLKINYMKEFILRTTYFLRTLLAIYVVIFHITESYLHCIVQ